MVGVVKTNEMELELISSLFGVGGILSALFTWLLNRRKMTADITEKIANAAATITTTNQSLITSLNARIEELEDDVRKLTEQNAKLILKLSEIGSAILETDGDHILKEELARLLK